MLPSISLILLLVQVSHCQIGSGPLSFDYLLGEDSYVKRDVNVIFIDHDVSKSVMTRYQKEGKTVICYVNVGAWEDWRKDARDFPKSVLGNDYEGWKGEKWLDIRNTNVLVPLMRKRFKDAQSKGCSGIDPDNMNGYTIKTGFPLKAQDQINYNRIISKEIRALGMMAGIKNDNEQAEELINDFDFAVLESCAAYDECQYFKDYPNRGKPVFAIEYTNKYSKADFEKNVCPFVKKTRLSFILKRLELKSDYLVTCK